MIFHFGSTMSCITFTTLCLSLIIIRWFLVVPFHQHFLFSFCVSGYCLKLDMIPGKRHFVTPVMQRWFHLKTLVTWNKLLSFCVPLGLDAEWSHPAVTLIQKTVTVAHGGTDSECRERDVTAVLYAIKIPQSAIGSLNCYCCCIAPITTNYFLLALCYTAPQQWRSQPKNLGVAKMFDFRRITLFCLEKHFSNHKMTIFSKNFGGNDSFGPP